MKAAEKIIFIQSFEIGKEKNRETIVQICIHGNKNPNALKLISVDIKI